MPTVVDLIGAANNLADPQPTLNRREAILGVIISTQVVSWACGLFRFYTRFFIIKSPWWDDLFVLLSMVSGWPCDKIV